MLIRRTAIGLVLALLVALPAMAQDFQKGLAAYKRGDYQSGPHGTVPTLCLVNTARRWRNTSSVRF